MQRPSTSSHWSQSLRYLLVGGLTVACYYAILGIAFSGLGLPHMLAVALAYGAALAVHFFANRSFTFRAQGADLGAQTGRYAALVVLNLLIQLAAVYLAHDVAGWNLYLAAGIGVVLTLVTGFILMRVWVFRGATTT